MIRRLLLTLLIATLTGCGASNDPPSLGVIAAEVLIFSGNGQETKGKLLPDSTAFMKIEKLIQSRAGRWAPLTHKTAADIQINTPSLDISLSRSQSEMTVTFAAGSTPRQLVAPLSAEEFDAIKSQINSTLTQHP